MYDSNQWRLIARELARSGRHIPSAVKALRRDYACFRTLSETTVRKLLKDQPFPDLVQEQRDHFVFAKESTERSAERARLRAEAADSHPLAQVLAKLIDELHDLAKTNHHPRTYKALCACLKLMHSLQLKPLALESEDAP